jgi:hypothetical protein
MYFKKGILMKYFVLIASTLVSTSSLFSMRHIEPTTFEQNTFNKLCTTTIANDLPNNNVFDNPIIGVKDAHGTRHPYNILGYNMNWDLKPNERLKLSPHPSEKWLEQGIDLTKKTIIDLYIPAALNKQYIKLHVGEGSTIQFGDTIDCRYNFANQNIQLIHNKVTILKELKTVHSLKHNKNNPCHIGLIEYEKK